MLGIAGPREKDYNDPGAQRDALQKMFVNEITSFGGKFYESSD